jgi:hypothetical protein
MHHSFARQSAMSAMAFTKAQQMGCCARSRPALKRLVLRIQYNCSDAR